MKIKTMAFREVYKLFVDAWELYRKWYRCPYCGKKLLIFNDIAKCDGVYINCRECRREVKIKI